MKKYQVYCNTDKTWETVISSAEPTQCPVNPAHEIHSPRVIKEAVLVRDGSHLDVTLNDLKQLRINEIDLRTQELIEQGFVYNSQTFSLSSSAQRNWLAVEQFKDSLTYPFGISTKDSGQYLIADATEAHTFSLTALGAAETHYSSGRALKQSVKSAVDAAAVDAVVDNR